MLPSINQAAQGLNVQTPRVPSGQQYAQGTAQNASGLPQRMFNSMAPDNGQHGGAPRYMTPTSGAMNMSVQRNTNPYGNAKTAYYGNQGTPQPIPNMFTPMTMSPEQQQQYQQGQMSYRQALQDRLLNQKYNQMGYMMPAQPVPQMATPSTPVNLPRVNYGG